MCCVFTVLWLILWVIVTTLYCLSNHRDTTHCYSNKIFILPFILCRILFLFVFYIMFSDLSHASHCIRFSALIRISSLWIKSLKEQLNEWLVTHGFRGLSTWLLGLICLDEHHGARGCRDTIQVWTMSDYGRLTLNMTSIDLSYSTAKGQRASWQKDAEEYSETLSPARDTAIALRNSQQLLSPAKTKWPNLYHVARDG